ncbi:MAG: bifunctional glutamate N-acetyltransferase/amino-acid acetyltransferase ArgJ [Planctomycetota bacterium]|nr:bifunctional glutamate N-acetyltransferase/amino-acid acetyltransferase ArgJ [Planctomycetota bacterium]MEE3367628.1 bifunctional glutamate N-acetyltransferase/amino-acid acetyltransferase ArgJ [Planctomycetota bacterium]
MSDSLHDDSSPALLPAGFRTAGVACGIKDDPDTLDLAVFAADGPVTAAGVFTQNRVCGAPVKVSRERVPGEGVRAVVVNSGNANACTGSRGIEDATLMTAVVAEQLGCDPEAVLVCSTGVIGHYLPIETIVSGIPRVVEILDDSPGAFHTAARAMMTTDTVAKQSVHEVQLSGGSYRVSGAAKGAAMIGPNMATMLAVVMTDVPLTTDQADCVLRQAVDASFNSISVEGHTSTSDSVLLLAGGGEGGNVGEADLDTVTAAVTRVCQDLARAIVADAEGADHLVQIDVNGMRTRGEAELIARTIADDALVKTAITGNDPNWGRIVSCCGRTGVELVENDITLSINGTRIFEKGVPVEYDETQLSASMRDAPQVEIDLSFPFGEESTRFWTCDLTTEYVRLNSEYTT